MSAFPSGGRDVSITLTAIDNMTPVLRTASAALGEYRSTLERTVSGISSMGAAAVPILAIGAAFIYAGQQAATVQQNVANLNAVLHTTADQLALIRQNGLALSQATQFTDAQILSAQRQLAKGGATAGDLAQTGSSSVTAATINLAGATQSDPTAAATSLVTAQTAFGLGNNDAARTATILAQAVDSSVGSLTTQAAAFKQTGATARAAGEDLKSTATAIADLQNSGMQNDAGTGLKTFLARIEGPTAAAKKEIDALGLSFFDMQGHLKPIPELFDEIHTKLSGLDNEVAQAGLQKIFGLRGIRVADIALEQGSQGYLETAQSMAEKGDAAEINARKLDTFSGSASKAGSSLNVFAVQMGTVLLPMMKGAADGVEGLTNQFTKLNNSVPIIPQMLVGAGALGGLALLQSRQEDRRNAPAEEQARQQAARDTVAERMRIAARATQDEAVTTAGAQQVISGASVEIKRDEEIAAQRIKSAQTYTAARTDLNIALLSSEAGTTEALRNLDTKYTSERMSNIAKQGAAIRELQATEQERADKAIAMSEIQMRQDAAALAIRQNYAHQRLDLNAVQGGAVFGADPQAHIDLSQQQALDRAQQQELAASRATFDTERARITKAGSDKVIQETRNSFYAERAALKAEYEQNIATVGEGGSVEREALTANFNAKVIALKRGEAEVIRQIEANAAAEVEATKITQAETVAAAGRTRAATEAEAGVIASSGVVTRNVVAAPKINSVAVTEAEKATVGSMIGGALGRLAIPALIAVTVKDMVLNPIEQAVYNHIADDPRLKDIHIKTNMVVDDTSGNFAQVQQGIERQRTAIQEEIRRQQGIMQSDAQMSTANAPVLGGLGSALAWVFGDDAVVGGAKKSITDLNNDLSQLQVTAQKTDLLPAQAMSQANDRLAGIIARVDAGKTSVEDATRAWKTLGTQAGDDTAQSLLTAGNSVDVVSAKMQDGTKTILDHAKAYQQLQQQAEATFQSNAQDAMRATIMGANTDTAAVAYLGSHVNGVAATKAETQDALKEIAELKTAWTGAQTTINQVDISKGFDAFGKLADNLRIANQELERVGQHNQALSGLGQIADTFKAVLDAEKLATQGMDAYNLTLQKTQGYLGEVNKVQTEFDQALEGAERRQAAGRATAADQTLIANRGNINATLDQQRQGLSQNMVLDVLGTVQNLPDFVALDKYTRDTVERFPGGRMALIATIEAETADAKQQIEDILKPRELKIIVIPEFQQFDTAMNERIARYQASMGQDRNAIAPVPPGSAGSGPGYGTPPGVYGGDVVGGVSTGASAGQPGAGSPLAYHPLSPEDYKKIIQSSSRGQSPLDDPAMYAAVMSAAQEKNVDPRLMLDSTRYENSQGTNMPIELNMANNFGGIKYRRGVNTDSGIAADNGGTYAKYATPEDFFRALAMNLSTGDYQQDYQSGNVEAIRRRYVVGGTTPGSREQEQNISNYTSSYQDYVKQYPWATGGNWSGGAPTRDQYGQGGDVTGAGDSSGSEETAFTMTRQKIVTKALSEIGIDKLVGYCEQFVEETVASITGKRGATGYNEQTAASAFAHGQAMGLETRDPKPGDLVYYPDAAGGTGHTAIYVGRNAQGVPQQVSTWDQGTKTGVNRQIHEEAVGAGARFLSIGNPQGVAGEVGDTVSATFNPYGAVGRSGAAGVPGYSGSSINGITGSPQAPIPVRIYPDEAAKSLPGYGAQMGQLDARGQGEMQSFYDRILPVLTTAAQDRMGFGATGTKGKPNTADTELIQNAGMKNALDLSTAYGAAIENINKGLAVTPAQWDAINRSAGALGPTIDAQVRATADLETHTQKLLALKESQQQADAAYQAEVEKRQTIDQADQRAQQQGARNRQADDVRIAAARRVVTEGEQDFDRARARKQALDQRVIDDSRTTQSRTWQDEQRQLADTASIKAEEQRQQDIADRNHKQNIDDAYQVVQRQEQDQQRLLTFRGGQQSIALQDARKAMDEQHRISTEGMTQNASLFVATGKGASTEAEATAFATIAAGINDARVKADDLYKKQADANQRAQDDLSKYHAQQMYDLESERIAAQRSHDDEMKAIDRTAQARKDTYNNDLYSLAVVARATALSHEMTLRQQQDEDKARQRSYENTTFQIETARIAEQRKWQDDDLGRTAARLAEDIRYQDMKNHEADLRTIADQNYKTSKLANQQQQQDEQTSITNINKQISGLDLVISKYDTLLKMFGSAADKALSIPAATPSTSSTSASTTTSGTKGYAVGSGFTPEGPATVNEAGGEIRVLQSGETIIPADQTRRLFDAILKPSGGPTPISVAPSYQEGDIHIHMGDGEVSLSAAAKAKIRAIIRQEIADSQPTTYSDVSASQGGMRR